ncbi:MAG: 4-hydroxy-3-methylbut-2-enyl diphosphate reductase [Proteobacteria bacterium]|nr:4-hydroxy-3-methylbut-2-enyl diphosphate reductase [Pseudomonadota bacterium]MBU1739857.1 4-hydroxy-3-methylbut-2-enyl diphosphate reductase [Pseudomonadota bacterium]
MKVILAKNAGFCMGVRRAVETTLDEVRRDKKIATLGPLIHNPQVLKMLEERGVEILREIPDQREGTVIIRAHGVPPESKSRLLQSGARVEDATCPRVLKVQAIISRHQQQGASTVIVGDRNHAEVEGLLGFAGGRGQVVSNDEEAKALQVDAPYIIVSQTTKDNATFERISNTIMANCPGGQVFNTICDSTHKRQASVIDLCSEVEAMVVVGGKESANTRRLGEIVSNHGLPVFLVETEEELDLASLAQFSCVGVTAGASTPSWMINRVIQVLESTPGPDESPFASLVYKAICALMSSNIYVALGGGLLGCAADRLMNGATSGDFFLMIFSYLFAMHNLNRFGGTGSGAFSDPVREKFKVKFRRPLLLLSWIALAFSLSIAYNNNAFSFPVLVVMSVLGALYSLSIFPRKLPGLFRMREIREIPGSKTFFVSFAWAFIIVVVPALGGGERLDHSLIGAFLTILLLVYIRSALYDIFELQGDRIIGKETLPVFIGRPRSLMLLYGIMIALSLMVTAGVATGWFDPLWLLLLPVLVYMFILSRLHEKDKFSYSPKLEFAVDSSFVIFALLVVAGVYLQH